MMHYSHRSKSVVIYVFYRCLFLVILREKRSKYHSIQWHFCWRVLRPRVNSRWQSTSTPPRPAWKEVSLMLKRKEPAYVAAITCRQKKLQGKVIFCINTLKFVFRLSLPHKPDRHTCIVLGKWGERKYGGRVWGKKIQRKIGEFEKKTPVTSVSPF